MRKSIFLLFILCSLIANAAEPIYTFGESIDLLPGRHGSYWHPKLTLTQFDSNGTDNLHMNMIEITMLNSENYYQFPDSSKILIKFNDNSIIELNSFGDVFKDYDTIEILHDIVSVYTTERFYVLTDDDFAKLMSLPIIKVRVELSNGNRKDWDIPESHGEKILKKLISSNEEITKLQKKRVQNTNTDLKSDF